MGKHILSDVAGFERRSDLFHVDPALIQVVNGWNDRTDFSGEEDLISSIREIGVRQPLKVRKTSEKTLELVDGERRLRAALKAREAGAEIKTVPVIVMASKTSEIDLYIDSIVANTGKPLTPVEEANSFKRLIAWGLQIKEISAKTGRSETHVRNRLTLADAIPDVKQAAEKKDITTGEAVEIVKESGGKVEPQKQALEKKRIEKKKPKAETISLSFKDGSLSIKGASIPALEEIMKDEVLKGEISASGYDPESLTITLTEQTD